MKAFKEKGFAERRDAAAKAKEDNLKKFSKKDQPSDTKPAAGKSSSKDSASAPAKKSAAKGKKG
ncbi:MAG: hypothetical protein ACFCUR_04250 [Rhodomicrobiaceae bacterium]